VDSNGKPLERSCNPSGCDGRADEGRHFDGYKWWCSPSHPERGEWGASCQCSSAMELSRTVVAVGAGPARGTVVRFRAGALHGSSQSRPARSNGESKDVAEKSPPSPGDQHSCLKRLRPQSHRWCSRTRRVQTPPAGDYATAELVYEAEEMLDTLTTRIRTSCGRGSCSHA
jgi:hypothetical protein